MELEWRVAAKDCRILVKMTGEIKNNETIWPKYYDWYCEMAIKLKEIFKKYDI